MSYGRKVMNFENAINGRTQRGTGCCGIAGAPAMARFAFWQSAPAAPPTISQEPLPGGLPGQTITSVFVASGLMGTFAGFGQVIPLTDSTGKPLPAADGMALVDNALSEIKASYEYAENETYYSPGLRQESNPQQRGEWYASHALNLESVGKEIRDQIMPAAAGLAIIKAAPDAASVASRLKAAQAALGKINAKILFIKQTIEGWSNEAGIQYALAQKIRDKATFWGQVKVYASTLSGTVDSLIGWIPKTGEALKEAAEGLKHVAEEGNTAVKTGIAGAAVLVGVGAIALLFMMGRKK